MFANALTRRPPPARLPIPVNARPAADPPATGPLVLVQAILRVSRTAGNCGGPSADALDRVFRSVSLTPPAGAWAQRAVRVVRVVGSNPSAPCETNAVGLWQLPPGLDAPATRAALTRLDGAVVAALNTLATGWDVVYQAYDPALHGSFEAWQTGRAAQARTRDAFPQPGDAPELPLRLPEETPRTGDRLYVLNITEQHVLEPIEQSLRGEPVWTLNVDAVNNAAMLAIRQANAGTLESSIPRLTVNQPVTSIVHSGVYVAVASNTLSLALNPMTVGFVGPGIIASFVARSGAMLISKFEVIWRVPASVPQANVDRAIQLMNERLRTVGHGFMPVTIAPFIPAVHGALEDWQSGEIQRRAVEGAMNPLARAQRQVESALGTVVKVVGVGVGVWVLFQLVSLYRAVR